MLFRNTWTAVTRSALSHPPIIEEEPRYVPSKSWTEIIRHQEFVLGNPRRRSLSLKGQPEMADDLSPTSRWVILFILNDQRRGWIDFSLAHLASVGIGIEAVIADHDLSFIRNMGGHTSDKLQIIHPLFLVLAFIILLANLAFCFIKGEPFQRQQRRIMYLPTLTASSLSEVLPWLWTLKPMSPRGEFSGSGRVR